MNKTIGFIGFGNMAKAIISGIKNSGSGGDLSIVAADSSPAALENAAGLGVCIIESNTELVKAADIIFLAVKPQVIESVLEEISSVASQDKLFVSIIAGRSLEYFAEKLGDSIPVIRTMPNTPALVGEGMTALCANEHVRGSEMEFVVSLFSGFGKAEVVPERLFDAVVGASGSSPAYVFMLIEAIADAAVEGGLPRAQAYTFAAQSVLGSAKMVLETGKHPGELKDMVCSPAGTTIEAVRVLEEKGFRGAVIAAVKACIEKSQNL